MFQVVETLVAAPGQCYFCGSAEKGLYLDCNTSIEFYGALYICVDCITDAGTLFGMLPKYKADVLRDESQKVHVINLELELKNQALKETIQSLMVSNFGEQNLMVVHESLSSNNADGVSSAVDSDSGSVETSSSNDEVSRDTSELMDFGTGTFDESSDDEGVDKLHSDEHSDGDKFRLNI